MDAEHLDQHLLETGRHLSRRARARLTAGVLDDAGVHAVRKDLKRLRALARLLQPVARGRDPREQDGAWRDVGRALGPLREARVRIDLLTELGETLPEPPPQLAAELERQAAVHQEQLDEAARAGLGADLAGRLGRVEGALADWRLPERTGPLLRPALGNSHRRARRAWRRLGAAPDADALHGWRRRVKELYYQLGWLEPAWPEGIGPQVHVLDRLGETLGEDHDAFELLRDLERLFPPGHEEGGHRAGATLRAALEQRRAALLATARRLAPLVLHEKPRAFGRRLAGYAAQRWA